MQSFWKRLPAAARALLAAGGVLALSLALTFALHNQDTWRTGLWDDTSQSLVFGRILQMQHGQSAPGGFLGTYAVDGDTAGNRYLFRENAVPDPDTFISYSHQTGLQGAAFGILNKVYSLFARGGEARERMLYATNAVLFYAATLVLAGAAWRAFGPLAGAGWLAAAVFSPWLQRGMKDIYWCTWTWLLPALAGLAVWALARRRGRVPPWGYVLVFAAVLVRCMCGFEFISDFLILCEIPLFAAWAQALAARRPARCWFGRMAGAGFAAVGGVLAALGVWLWQNRLYFGSWGAAWANVLEASTRHTVGGEMSIPAVIGQYVFSQDPVLQFCPLALPPLALVVLGAAALALYALAQKRCGGPGLFPALASVWGLSLLAPLSWMALAKMHCQIHTHLVPMLWNFALAPATLLALGALAHQALRPAGVATGLPPLSKGGGTAAGRDGGIALPQGPAGWGHLALRLSGWPRPSRLAGRSPWAVGAGFIPPGDVGAAAGSPGTMQASSPTGVAITQSCGLPGWAQLCRRFASLVKGRWHGRRP